MVCGVFPGGWEGGERRGGGKVGRDREGCNGIDDALHFRGRVFLGGASVFVGGSRGEVRQTVSVPCLNPLAPHALACMLRCQC